VSIPLVKDSDVPLSLTGLGVADWVPNEITPRGAITVGTDMACS